jgi:hypothetical protein
LREGERGRDESGRLRRASASDDRGDITRPTSAELVLCAMAELGSRVWVDSRDKGSTSSSVESLGADTSIEGLEVDDASVNELLSSEVVSEEMLSVPPSAFAFFAAAFVAFFSSLFAFFSSLFAFFSSLSG